MLSKEMLERVARWNEARYERVYDPQLAINLLREEVDEFREAGSLVDAVDACCDVIYVALGILWKVGVDDTNYEMVRRNVNVAQLQDCHPLYHAYAELAIYEDHRGQAGFELSTDEYDKSFPIIMIGLALSQMHSLGLTDEQMQACFFAVCDSNDTKIAKRTEANVKANIDKGGAYIPPTAALEEILANVSH